MIDGAKTHDDIEMASERSFALVFAGFLANVGCCRLIHGHSLRLWALAIAAAFFVLGLWRPSVLRPFNVVWFKLSRLLANPRTQVAIIAGLMMPRRSRRSITLNVSDWTEPFSGVVTPIVMGLLYVTTIIPTSLVLRMRGKDLLGFAPQSVAIATGLFANRPDPRREA